MMCSMNIRVFHGFLVIFSWYTWMLQDSLVLARYSSMLRSCQPLYLGILRDAFAGREPFGELKDHSPSVSWWYSRYSGKIWNLAQRKVKGNWYLKFSFGGTWHRLEACTALEYRSNNLKQQLVHPQTQHILAHTTYNLFPIETPKNKTNIKLLKLPINIIIIQQTFIIIDII